jgi:thymidine phosphorylase
MRHDCAVCRSEGLAARAQVALRSATGEIIASLMHGGDDLLEPGEIGLCDASWAALEVGPGDAIVIAHPLPMPSLAELRRRVYGNRLGAEGFASIVRDIAARRYADIHLSAFVTACSAFPLDRNETIALTQAMIDTGDRLTWPEGVIVDKHSVGGLPGNRTTPIVVAIMASAGMVMPKTSSRAITSPAGTADTMEVLAPVDLDLASIRRVVAREGGCVAWGGSVRLSPADDVIINVERVLDMDATGQLVASVLSKKIAAGATHLVIDIPVGATAKVRSAEAAASLSSALESVAQHFGLKTRILLGPGDQPIGRGIGPALEARDVIAALQGAEGVEDLRRRACELAGALFELTGNAEPGGGFARAEHALKSGRAWQKFQRICEAQGGMRTPPFANHRHELRAVKSGKLASIDNRKIAAIAKLAGAPAAKAAGVEMAVRLGDSVEVGSLLCTIHAESRGELDYALAFASGGSDAFGIVAA